MNIYFWGDSLTRGQLGYSYVPDSRAGTRHLNFGKNGDTAYGIFKRMLTYAADAAHAQGIYVVAAGTNDLLLQYKLKASLPWRLRALSAIPLKRPAKDVRAFERTYRSGIKKLRERVPRIVLVGIPYFEIEKFPQQRIRQYNAVIAQIAADYALPFVDCYGIQETLMDGSDRRFCRHCFSGVAFTTAAMKLCPQTKDVFSSQLNLSVTVDGVHLNRMSATAIGKELAQRLL